MEEFIERLRDRIIDIIEDICDSIPDSTYKILEEVARRALVNRYKISEQTIFDNFTIKLEAYYDLNRYGRQMWGLGTFLLSRGGAPMPAAFGFARKKAEEKQLYSGYVALEIIYKIAEKPITCKVLTVLAVYPEGSDIPKMAIGIEPITIDLPSEVEAYRKFARALKQNKERIIRAVNELAERLYRRFTP